MSDPFSFDRAALEERASPDRIQSDPQDRHRISGRAIPFNSVSKSIADERIGKFREVIHPDAVDRTLRDPSGVKALWNHNADLVLGAVRSGTLRLMKTGAGLFVHIHPPNWASNYVETVERGDVDGMSFRFMAMDGEWDFRTPDGIPIRTVTDMEFREVSIVPFPAYADARVGLSQRSLDEFTEARAKHHGHSIAWLRKVHQTRLAG